MSAVFSRSFVRASLIIMFAVAGAGPLRAEGKSSQINVVVDQAKLVKVPDQVATIVVGNPLIADVSLQSGGAMVVTGKGYGSTNMIVMDRAGEILEERSIVVEGPTEKLVTVFRGLERETYSCTPVCQRSVTLGDGATYFNANLSQGGTLSQRATAAANVPAQRR